VRFLRRKQHIFWSDAPAAAIGGVKIPVGGAEVVGGRKAEGFCGAIDGLGSAFEFEDDADWGFVEVEVQVAEAKAGAEFFIAEAGMKAESVETAYERVGIVQGKFAFGTFFVARSGVVRLLLVCRRRCRSLGGEDRAAPSGRLAMRGGGSFNSHAEQPAGPAEIGSRRVEKGVSFEYATVRNGADGSQFLQDAGQIRDSEFYFGLRLSRRDFAHASV
jgi:hypothetical protein